MIYAGPQSSSRSRWSQRKREKKLLFLLSVHPYLFCWISCCWFNDWNSFIYSYLKMCIWFEPLQYTIKISGFKGLFPSYSHSLKFLCNLKVNIEVCSTDAARWALAIIYQSDITFLNNTPHCLTTTKIKKKNQRASNLKKYESEIEILFKCVPD